MENLNKYWDKIHLKYSSIYDGWLDKYLNLIEKDGLIEIFKDFKIYNLEYKVMDRYDKPKTVWEFCVKK